MMKVLFMNVGQGYLLGKPSDCIALTDSGLGEHRIRGLAGEEEGLGLGALQ